jgi:hypothetical protein
MKYIPLLVIGCLLAGCGGMNPVEGAPEVMVQDDINASVSVQPDGKRLVTISAGKTVRAIIMLPPLPPAKVDAPVTTVPTVERDER